jgi:cell wall-associated NlpC family hydrolase
VGVIREMKSQRRTLAEIIGDFANKPPSHVHNDPVNGYSCLGFCYHVLAALGKNPPYGDDEVNIDNYEKLYPSGEQRTFDRLIEFAKTMGNEVAPHEVLAGDFVLLQDRRGHVFPAIYTGNGQVMMCFEYCGVRSFAYAGKAKIIIARRL